MKRLLGAGVAAGATFLVGAVGCFTWAMWVDDPHRKDALSEHLAGTGGMLLAVGFMLVCVCSMFLSEPW